MEGIISAAKAEFTRAQNRIVKDLTETPADKLDWAPSPTARTPLQLVAHVALSVEGMQGMFHGETLDMSNLPALDAQWREDEKAFKTREEVLALLDKNCAAYLTFLDTVTPEQIESTLNLPFGAFPFAAVITWPADHIRCHSSQLEYLQTIYGDLDWHM
jgi:hypothetical protein